VILVKNQQIFPHSSVGRVGGCFIKLNQYNIMDSKQKGNITELEVLTYITKLGYQVSIPFGDRERYDQIWDINGKLLKIQIKTSHYIDEEENGIKFSCRSNTKVGGKIQHARYTKDEIDYFATMWNNQCYLVPINECSNEKTLRLQYPSNGQKQGINLAEYYTAEKQIQKLMEGVV
jgi:hypothetical protein